MVFFVKEKSQSQLSQKCKINIRKLPKFRGRTDLDHSIPFTLSDFQIKRVHFCWTALYFAGTK